MSTLIPNNDYLMGLFSSFRHLPIVVRDVECANAFNSVYARLQTGVKKISGCIKEFVRPAFKVPAPRIFSTVKGELNLPLTLEEANENQPRTDGNESQTEADSEKNRSKIYEVDVTKFAGALREIETLFNSYNVLCAFDMPKGRMRLVACPRQFGRHENIFLSSELRFLESLPSPNVGEDLDLYFLCCNGFKEERHIKDMLFTVAKDVTKRKRIGRIMLACPLGAESLLESTFRQLEVTTERRIIDNICVDIVDMGESFATKIASSSVYLGINEVIQAGRPPLAIFRDNKVSKILWHTGGRTVIRKEHKLWFTGTGVKVRRQSFIMWSVIILGFGVTIGYVIARSGSTIVEDLLQTALSIFALYAASVIPLAYYMFYDGENLLDVVTGKVHLDTRKEFEKLNEEERLHLCLQSLKLPESDRMFIDRHNTGYATGTAAGAAMRVNYLPCIENLLGIGFRYWEYEKSKGLVSPTQNVFELRKVGGKRKMMRLIDPEVPNEQALNYERTILRLLELKIKMNPCLCGDHYVGLS